MNNLKLLLKNRNIRLSLTGLIAGLVNGLFGGGGGMIIVFLLLFLLKYPSKIAHATAILTILPMSLASGILYASSGTFKLNVGLPVTIGVLIGGILGALLLSKLSSKVLIIIFSVVMCFAGLKMLVF